MTVLGRGQCDSLLHVFLHSKYFQFGNFLSSGEFQVFDVPVSFFPASYLLALSPHGLVASTASLVRAWCPCMGGSILLRLL